MTPWGLLSTSRGRACHFKGVVLSLRNSQQTVFGSKAPEYCSFSKDEPVGMFRSVRFCLSSSAKVLENKTKRKSKKSSDTYFISFMFIFFSLPTLSDAICRMMLSKLARQFLLEHLTDNSQQVWKTFMQVEELIYLSSVLHIALCKCLVACKGYCRLSFSWCTTLFKIISILLGHR